MEVYRTNLLKTIKDIKDIIDNLSELNKTKLKKNISHQNLSKRPKFGKTKYKIINKTEMSKILDQIGNDDLMFSKDKLITNIKIESFEKKSKKNSSYSAGDNRSFLRKKTHKMTNRNKYITKKNISTSRNDLKELYNVSDRNGNPLELNCNKISFETGYNKFNMTSKRQNNKKSIMSPHNKKNLMIKNVDQFINKPSTPRKIIDRNFLMSPLYNKTSVKNTNITSKKKLLTNDFDVLSLSSPSRMDGEKHFNRVKSMPTIRDTKKNSNLHMPNKSLIKKQDKVVIELQKLFGEKFLLNEDTYQNMTELDKKNCISFLLEVIREFNNAHKANQAKMDGFKQIIEFKDQQIKTHINEVKELKKENNKLNKVIRTNNQLNKKLSQNVENLKIQLEKEKIKLKTFNERGNSNSKIINVYTNRYKKENNMHLNKKKGNLSQDKETKKSSRGINNIINTERSTDKIIKTIGNNNENNDIDEKIKVNKINITWKNNDNKMDVSPNSLTAHDSKESDDFKKI